MTTYQIIKLLEASKVLPAALDQRFNVDKLSLLIAFATETAPDYKTICAVSDVLDVMSRQAEELAHH